MTSKKHQTNIRRNLGTRKNLGTTSKKHQVGSSSSSPTSALANEVRSLATNEGHQTNIRKNLGNRKNRGTTSKKHQVGSSSSSPTCALDNFSPRNERLCQHRTQNELSELDAASDDEVHSLATNEGHQTNIRKNLGPPYYNLMTPLSHMSMKTSMMATIKYLKICRNMDHLSDDELCRIVKATISLEEAGLSENTITRRLHTREYVMPEKVLDSGNSVGVQKSENLESCNICMEAYKKEEKIAMLYYCRHEYHADCLKKWVSKKNVCPICRGLALLPEVFPDWEGLKTCKKAMRPVDEEPYEVRLDNHGCHDGPKTGRLSVLNNAPKLFSGLNFYFSGDFVSGDKEDLQNLVITAGGEIVDDKEELVQQSHDQATAPSRTLVVYNLNPPQGCKLGEEVTILRQRLNEAEELAAKIRSQVIGHTWLLESIASYKLQPFVSLH